MLEELFDQAGGIWKRSVHRGAALTALIIVADDHDDCLADPDHHGTADLFERPVHRRQWGGLHPLEVQYRWSHGAQDAERCRLSAKYHSLHSAAGNYAASEWAGRTYYDYSTNPLVMRVSLACRAQREAFLAAREVLISILRADVPVSRDYSARVVDEHGIQLHAVTLKEALDEA